MSEVIPLPPFVLEYLQKKNVRIVPNTPAQGYGRPPQNQNLPNLSNSSQINAKASSSIELLSFSETPQRINGCYIYFVNDIVNSAPPFLQHEFRQFIFPVFISLANILFKQGLDADPRKFVERYRYNQPSETQQIIDDLLANPPAFEVPKFNIKICQEAYTELMISIDRAASSPKTALLSQVLTDTIFSIEITPTNDQFLFSNDEVASMRPNMLPLINLVSTELKPFSAIYNGELPPSKPQILTEDDTIPYIHQNMPDIANIEVLNHDGRVNCISISPNARLYSIAKGNNVTVTAIDGVSKLNGKDSAILVSHRGQVLTTCFSNDSRYLASAGLDHIIKVSNLEAFIPILAIKAGVHPIYALAFDPSSTFLASASADMSIMIWNIRTGHPVRMFVGHTLPVTKVLFSADSKRLISCSEDMTVRIWDVEMQVHPSHAQTPQSVQQKVHDTPSNLIATINTHSTPTCICLDSTNAHLAIGMRDGSVALWDTQKGIKLWEEKELEAPVTDIKCTLEKEPYVIAGSVDGFIKIWRCDDKGELLLKVDAISSTIDTICITERNSVMTAGRSLRGEVVI